MADNLRHWNALCGTDPKHTKKFKRTGGFEGTAIKPIWSTKQMTEHFGPCGIGWGMEKPEFTVQSAGDETLVFCTIAVWYVDTQDAQTVGKVYGIGGDKVLTKNRHGPVVNDEAFKAAYTDALSNAFKQIGVGADVHMGLFDDAKYVRQMEQEFAEDAPAPSPAPKASTAPAPATGQQKPPRNEEFYRRQSYEITPEAAGGTLKGWESAYRAAIAGCKNLDELAKLEEDCRVHFTRFCDKGRPEVVEDIRKLVTATEDRLRVGIAA